MAVMSFRPQLGANCLPARFVSDAGKKGESERKQKTKKVFKWPRCPIGSLCSSSNKALDDKDVFQCGRC